MWKCCRLAIHNFRWCKQQVGCKCLRSSCYVGQVTSRLLHVSRNVEDLEGDDERPLVRVARELGLQPERLLKVAEQSANLSQASLEQVKNFFSHVLANGLNCDVGLAMLAADPSFLSLNPSKLSESVEQWRNCQLGEENLKRLLACHPDFLLIHASEIAKRIPLLKNLCGTNRNLYNLLQNCPRVMSENRAALKNKIDYLQCVMKVENVRIAKSLTLEQSLKTIRTRHVFLERCGRYVVPNMKVDPLVANKNPSLSNITDTSDKYFATKVAGLTLEEYEVFCELYEQEVAEEKEEDYSDSDTEEL